MIYMSRVSIVLVLLVSVILGGSCATQPQERSSQYRRTQYIEQGTIISGRPDQLTMYDLESSVQLLMKQMLASRPFAQNYNAAKTAKGRLPIVVIDNIDNKVRNERFQSRLVIVGNMVRQALYDSGLFSVKDDEAADAIKSRILRGADGGLEKGTLVQKMGEHSDPDFMVDGDLRREVDESGYYTYKLRLAIHSLTTGEILWEGTQTRIKL